jgi:XTP/dITP diphosphohydrolase
MELILATRNPDKGRELAALLKGLPVILRSLAEFPDAPEVEEDGKTCRENAEKKARIIAQFTGLPAVADDTGLMVDALGGRPGVHAARYAGDRATYEDNWLKLLRELEGVPRAKRTARFITVAALAWSPSELQVVEGELRGEIAEAPAGSQGFGYDPVFVVPHFHKTLAQLAPDEKNRISHRARAFQQVRALLSQRLASKI